jgi:hypothetical protein
LSSPTVIPRIDRGSPPESLRPHLLNSESLAAGAARRAAATSRDVMLRMPASAALQVPHPVAIRRPQVVFYS